MVPEIQKSLLVFLICLLSFLISFITYSRGGGGAIVFGGKAATGSREGFLSPKDLQKWQQVASLLFRDGREVRVQFEIEQAYSAERLLVE